MLLAYLRHTSGYRRSQLTPLVQQGEADQYRAPAALFARKYTPSDIGLLVQMNRANLDVWPSRGAPA